MIIDTFTNTNDRLQARIIQNDSNHWYVVQFWDTDANEMLPSTHITPFLDLARKTAREFVDGTGGGSVAVW